MIPRIRSSRACRPVRSKPRNPAATRATLRSNATLVVSPRAQMLPWELRYPLLAVWSLLRESGTTLGAKDSVLHIKHKRLDRLGPLYDHTKRRYPHILHSDSPAYILTNVFTIYNSSYKACEDLFRIFNCCPAIAWIQPRSIYL
jgi:hypothetical protein